jgi:hypothetical protein
MVHSTSSGEGRKSQGRGYNRLDKAAVPNPEKTAFTFTFTQRRSLGVVRGEQLEGELSDWQLAQFTALNVFRQT